MNANVDGFYHYNAVFDAKLGGNLPRSHGVMIGCIQSHIYSVVQWIPLNVDTTGQRVLPTISGCLDYLNMRF